MERVCKTYGDRTLLGDVSFYRKEGDWVGVVAINGCGKSTFFRLAAGKEMPGSGSVSYDLNVRLGYLPRIHPLTRSDRHRVPQLVFPGSVVSGPCPADQKGE